MDDVLLSNNRVENLGVSLDVGGEIENGQEKKQKKRRDNIQIYSGSL